MRARAILVVLGLAMLGLTRVAADDRADELIQAAANGDIDGLTWILNEGADPNAAGENGTIALVEAVRNRWYPAVDVLLDAGADPDIRDRYNNPVILMAARRGDLDVVQALIAAGAGLEGRDTDGVEMVSNQAGVTALWVAARWGMTDVVRVLLAAGADPSVQDYDGIPAWGAARSNGHMEIYEMLDAAGATVPKYGDDEGL